jgi:hypothetical protein
MGKDLTELRDKLRSEGKDLTPDWLKDHLVPMNSPLGATNRDSEGQTQDEPRPAKQEAAFPALGLDAFYGPLGRIAKAIEPENEAHVAPILLQLIVGFGNLVGRSPYATVGTEYHHANLYGLIVGQSSKSRKGTSWSPVRTVLKEIDPDWVANCLKNGLSSREGLIYHVRDAEYSYDKKERKDVIVDSGVTDKRLMIQESEFAQPITVMGRKDNTLSAVFRSAYETGNLNTLTKNNPLKATGAHISTIGHITKEELMRLLPTHDFFNGFANRFLWIAAKRVRMLPEGGNFRVESIPAEISSLRRAIDAARNNTAIVRSDEATKYWAEIYPCLSKDRFGKAGIVCNRAEAQVLRLSMLYAIADASPTIELVHLRAALAVWQYCEDSAKWIFGNDPANPDTLKILHKLRQAGAGGLMLSQIRREVFSDNKSSDEVSHMLKELEAAELAFCKKVKTNGPPAERWFAISAPGAT